MLLKTFTQSGNPPATGRPRGWQNYLSRLVALVTLLGGLGASQHAWGQQAGINNNAVVLTLQQTGQSSNPNQYYAGANNDSPYDSYDPLGRTNDPTNYSPPQLGTYDLDGNSSIVLTAASLTGITTTSNTTVTAARIQYRVYLSSTPSGSIPTYSNYSLNVSQSGSNFSANNSGASINLLSGLTSGSTYIIEVRFQADLSRTTTNPRTGVTTTTTGQANDLSGSDYYYANFYVTPPANTPTNGTTTWQSTTATGGSTDWTLASNWSNGVPTATSDAIIPSKTDPTLVYPKLDNPNYPYAVRKLTLQGNSNSTAAQLSIAVATLTVYGDIIQPAGGLAGNVTNAPGVLDKTQNSTIILAGANQTITGQLVVSDIIIAGSGTKSIINQLVPANIIAFRPASVTAGVIVQSAAQDATTGSIDPVFDTTGNSYIQLTATSIISAVSGDSETKYSYIKGVTRADRQVTAGVTNTFGNIGLDITANHTPGRLFLYRVVGDALTGPTGGSTAVPIKRQYRIVGDDDSNSSAGANSTVNLIFHYLDSDATTSANELNGIKEENLYMFSTTSNGAPYTALGGTVDVNANILYQANIPSLSDYKVTLGDRTNPLPVSLVAFGAVRNGANVLLSWTTASEERNTGFNVQVSTDGTNFRTLSFVASQSPNSSTTLNYKYTDIEAGKIGTRYYRLEQVDEGGAKNYSPVRIVNFSGSATGTGALVAYPNPFNEGISLSFDGGTIADGTALVKLVDMTGRTVRESKLPLVGSSLTLSDLSALRSGLYLAKVTLSDGSTQTVRISKL